MFKYFDNKQNGLLGEYILNNINSSSKISVITKVISVYSYYFLKKNIKSIEEIRILLTENNFEAIDPTIKFEVINGIEGLKGRNV